MINLSLLGKFRRRAPLMQSQVHLDKAMALFPMEHHEEIAAVIQPLLKKPITARKVGPVELKPKDPENPTLHESTVQRLNNQAALIETLKAENAALKAAQTISEPQIDKV